MRMLLASLVVVGILLMIFSTIGLILSIIIDSTSSADTIICAWGAIICIIAIVGALILLRKFDKLGSEFYEQDADEDKMLAEVLDDLNREKEETKIIEEDEDEDEEDK
jgi:uncharacterized protein YacL